MPAPTTTNGTEEGVGTPLKHAATTIDFNLDGPKPSPSEGEGTPAATSIRNVILDEEGRQPSDLAELLMAHHQYAHISMRKLQEMAKQGVLPKCLAKCRIPTCSACLYSKATKRPWRGKQSKKGSGRDNPRRPGHIVSVDQLVSPTPGLISPITGFLTTNDEDDDIILHFDLRGPRFQKSVSIIQ